MLEALILSAVLGAALLPVALLASTRVARATCAVAWLVASLLGAFAATAYRNALVEPPVRNRPLELTRDDYASSDACRSCHPSQYESWHRSFHRTMTQVVSPETVLGDFEAGPLRIGSQEYELGRDDDGFWVTHYDLERQKRVRRRVVMSTGSHHMQFYWFSLDDDERELGFFPFAWLKEDQRWTPRTAVFMGEERHESVAEHGRWNRDCLFCHSTAPRPRMTPPRLKTEAVEFGIACEACHGPGGPHVEAHARDPLGRYQAHLDEEGGDDSIVQPARLPKQAAVEVCGQCHGVTLLLESWAEHERASVHGFRYRPGDSLDETGRVVLRGGEQASEPRIAEALERYDFDLETTFWSDGMVRVPREHNGLLDSPCYQRGEMTCQSCHVMHKTEDDPRSWAEWTDDQLGPGMRGDAACLQCHPQLGTDLTAHTNHAEDSPGSRCQNCHMPYTTYALLKAIRQHEIDVPSVAASVETGRPNACNACHLDRSLGWTAARMSDWYGQPEPALDEAQREEAAGVAWMIRGDAAQRGLAAWYGGWEPARLASGDWMAPHLAQLLEDPYPAVRYIAWHSLLELPDSEGLDFDYVGPREERAEVRRAVWRHFDQRREPPGERGKALLLYPDGSLDQIALRDMLERRDDRRVVISE